MSRPSKLLQEMNRFIVQDLTHFTSILVFCGLNYYNWVSKLPTLSFYSTEFLDDLLFKLLHPVISFLKLWRYERTVKKI